MPLYIFTPLSYLLFAAALVALVTAGFAFSRRRAPGALFLALLELAVAQWSASIGFEAAATRLELKILWSQIAYLGTAAAPLLFCLFALDYSQTGRPRSGRLLAAMSVVPALAVVAAATNGLHGQLWPQIEILPERNMAVYSHGPWFWIFVTYSYLLVAIGMGSLYLSVVRFPAHYASQLGALIVGTLLPFASNVLYVSPANPYPEIDWTPIGFSLSGVVLAFAIFRLRLFDLVPVARARLLAGMPDGVVVLDERQRVIDLNPSARRLLGGDGEVRIGETVQPALAGWLAGAAGEGRETFDLVLDGGRRALEARASPLLDPAGRSQGWIVMLRDVTERRQAELGVRSLNEQLTTQLSEIEALQERLREEAIRDPLTGVFNRRYLDETLRRELAQAARGGFPLSLVLIDLDRLKDLNDTHGHAAGDQVLRAVAEAIGRSVRAGDALCRLGGDEFAVVMSNASLEHAGRRAEAWRAAVEALPVEFNGAVLRTTVSCGAAAYPGQGADAEALAAAADRALYAAKRAGRNRAVVAGAEG